MKNFKLNVVLASIVCVMTTGFVSVAWADIIGEQSHDESATTYDLATIVIRQHSITDVDSEKYRVEAAFSRGLSDRVAQNVSRYFDAEQTRIESAKAIGMSDTTLWPDITRVGLEEFRSKMIHQP